MHVLGFGGFKEETDFSCCFLDSMALEEGLLEDYCTYKSAVIHADDMI